MNKIYSNSQRFMMIQKSFQQSFSSSSDSPVIIDTLTPYMKRIVLNKPKVLNSLDLEMMKILTPYIPQFNNDLNLKAIWIEGAGGKAFCAGGDIKSLYDAKKSGDQSQMKILEDFFRHEFTLDYTMTQMKPVQVSNWDGIVMGGGVGISVHSPIRIATESTLFAMPEAKIGLFTDVAGGYFLSRLRNNLGMYLGLTGARLKGEDVVRAGVANYFVEKAKILQVKESLEKNINAKSNINDIINIIQPFTKKIEGQVADENQIKQLFNSSSFQELINNMKSDSSDFAQKTLKTIYEQNAISVRVIYDQINKGINMNLKECFISDYRITQRMMDGNDFFEGVRTVLIDKKDTPKWTYKDPLDVPQDQIDAYFKPLTGIKELEI